MTGNMDTSKAQKLWFLLNKIDRTDQSEINQDKLAYPYFYLLHWNERFSLLMQQKVALQSSQRKQYFQSIYDITEEAKEISTILPSEEIKALQDSLIDQFIANQPTLAKPKRSEMDDFPQNQTLSQVEKSLIPKLVDQIILDLFNKIAGDW